MLKRAARPVGVCDRSAAPAGIAGTRVVPRSSAPNVTDRATSASRFNMFFPPSHASSGSVIHPEVVSEARLVAEIVAVRHLVHHLVVLAPALCARCLAHLFCPFRY